MSIVFFFKQKTAYEMLRSLVGSEMCIRDSKNTSPLTKKKTILIIKIACILLNEDTEKQPSVIDKGVTVEIKGQ